MLKIYKMTLIKSISGIRGTIGGKQGENLTPLDAVKYAAAYGCWLKQQATKEHCKVVVGRDARISGHMMQQLVMNTLVGLGIHVVDLDLSTTPTVEVAVVLDHADGGIILTASHNPKQWNALKLLNHKGEFLNAKEGQMILDIAENESIDFCEVDNLGKITTNHTYIDLHIDKILDLPLVNVEAIKKAKFKVVVDGVNSTGGIAVPALLEALGVEPVKLYCTPNGEFPHNPEPLKEHLSDLMNMVIAEHADFGIVVDPDVDRLAFVDENGNMFGEEYTLVAVADYVLQHTPGNTVSNMSSSRALSDITKKRNGSYTASAVGEVNASKNFVSMLRPVVKSTPNSCKLMYRTTILISSTHHIINSYSKLFIVATPNKTIKILPYLVTRAYSPLLVHISRSIDAFATAKQPYESSWSVQSPETIGKCSFTFSRA